MRAPGARLLPSLLGRAREGRCVATAHSSQLLTLGPESLLGGPIFGAAAATSLDSSPRQVHLTADASASSDIPPGQEGSPVAREPSSEAALEEVRAPLEVVRPLYKALLLAARELSLEFDRYKSSDILSATELAWLQDKSPASIALIKNGMGNKLDVLISKEFRKPLDSAQYAGSQGDLKEELSSRLDTGFGALALISKRVGLLRSHAVESKSDHLSHCGIRVMVESWYNTIDRRIGSIYHYKVRLRNEASDEPMQLISRHWLITDFDGRTHQVIGPGVIGNQPVLHRGEEFEYESFTPLNSKRGTQRGTFSMMGLRSRELFEVDIAPFALAPP